MAKRHLGSLYPTALARSALEQRQVWVLMLTAVGYFTALVMLLPLVGAPVAALAIAPAALAGAFYGMRFGAAAGLAAWALSAGILLVFGYRPGDVLLRFGNGVGALVVMVVAVGFGRMRDLARRAERLASELRTKEERLQRVIADAPVAIYVADSHGRCTFAGGAALVAAGLSAQDLLAGSAEGSAITAAMRSALAGSEVQRRFTYGGRTFEAHFAPLTDENGGRGMIAVAVDVTSSEQMFAALRESEERLHAVLSTFPLIVLTIEPDGTISRSEGSGLEALGLRHGELDGRSVLELTRSGDQALCCSLQGDAPVLEAEIGGAPVGLRFAPGIGTAAAYALAFATGTDQRTAEEHRPVSVGEYLVADGTISRAQLDEAIQEQSARHDRAEEVTLGAVLLERGAITEAQLGAALDRRARETQIDQLGR